MTDFSERYTSALNLIDLVSEIIQLSDLLVHVEFIYFHALVIGFFDDVNLKL